jgi:hypothetical protein
VYLYIHIYVCVCVCVCVFWVFVTYVTDIQIFLKRLINTKILPLRELQIQDVRPISRMKVGNVSIKCKLYLVRTVLAYFPYFEKIKVGLSDHHAVCVCIPPQLTFDFLNQSLLNLVRISRHLSPSQRPN